METDATNRARIVFVSQPTSAGVAAVVQSQVRHALAQDYEVIVACPPPRRGPLAHWVTASGATHVEVDMRRAPSFLDLIHLWKIWRAIGGADLVHLHSSKAGALGRVAARLRRHRPPIIFMPHAWSWSVGGLLEPLYRSIERLLSGWADVIVSVSPGEAEEGRRVLGDHPNIRVVNNGVDLDAYRPDGPSAPATDAPLLVCVGRLSRQKGQDVAIRALSSMRHRNAILRLIGDGDIGPDLYELASKLGVAERVRFAGFDDPRPHLRAADVVIVPSRWEGMSLALIEAMACGTAIVVTDVSGSEIATDAAEIVPVEDPEALAAVTDALLDDPLRRRSLQAAARARALSFDIRETLPRIAEIWDELVSRS